MLVRNVHCLIIIILLLENNGFKILLSFKNINTGHFYTTVGYIFSKYVHCDMRFLVVKISALLCFLNCFGIAVPVYSY